MVDDILVMFPVELIGEFDMLRISKIPVSVNVTVGTTGTPVYNGLIVLTLDEDESGLVTLANMEFDQITIKEAVMREIEVQCTTNVDMYNTMGKIILSEKGDE